MSASLLIINLSEMKTFFIIQLGQLTGLDALTQAVLQARPSSDEMDDVKLHPLPLNPYLEQFQHHKEHDADRNEIREHER